MKVNIGLEGVVSTYDAATLAGSGSLSKTELTELSDELFYHLIQTDNQNLRSRINMFIRSLMEQRPSTALGQKCGMDVPENIAVDLKGNVTTCQNVGTESGHLIGNVTNLEKIKLKKYTHLSNRENCLSCPVLQLCQGSCMFLEDELFEQSCKNEFALNMAFFRASIYMMTGKILVDIVN